MQNITCHEGKCEELDGREMDTIFNEMFDDDNIVDQIQHDLVKGMVEDTYSS